jgi:N-acetylglucosamine repressor
MASLPTSIKEINQYRILDLLRHHPGISRSEIVSLTGLGKATISSIISDFMTNNIIYEIGPGKQRSSAGRSPIRLSLKGNARLAIGVELTGSECIAILTDLYANPILVERRPLTDKSVETSLGLIHECISQLMKNYDSKRLLGVGIGVPGPVDSNRQHVIFAENLGWFDIPLGPMLSERLSKPVTVIKRQNAAALGEYWYGVGKGKSNLIFVNVSVGISCGIIINDALYEGLNGSAGAIGHATIEPNGIQCKCGNYGCLETRASSAAIVIRVREKIKQGYQTILNDWVKGALQSITSHMVIEAALKGDSLALEIIEEAVNYLGIAIANLINTLNPALIIVGGDFLKLGDVFFGPLQKSIQKRSFSMSVRGVEVLPSSLGYQASAIGAASLIIDSFFYHLEAY